MVGSCAMACTWQPLVAALVGRSLLSAPGITILGLPMESLKNPMFFQHFSTDLPGALKMADFESLEVSNFRDIKPKKPLCPSSFPALRFESSCSTAIVGATAECQAPKLMARGGNAQCNAKSPAVGGWEAEILQPSNLQHLKK